jgi:DNA-binding response OmpR family regulator
MSETTKKILIVEDELVFAMDLSNHLRKQGYEVTAVASNGLEAIMDAEKDKPDIILMDIRLKGKLDGVDTGKIIHQKLNIPIIYISALTDESTKKSVENVHPSAFLTKPFDEEELDEAIKNTLSNI